MILNCIFAIEKVTIFSDTLQCSIISILFMNCSVNSFLRKLPFSSFLQVIWGKAKENEADLRLRWGVGRLVADAKVSPIVVPFWHEGMEEVSPMKQPYAFHLMKSWINGPQNVTISVGRPLTFDDVRTQLKQNQISAVEARERITAVIQDSLYKLRESTLKAHMARKS